MRTLIDGERDDAEPVLPQSLRELYDGDLRFPVSSGARPYVIGNFVSTLDGIVSFKVKGHSSGSTISGSDSGDRFIMGLLRASADAVMVGAGTVHDVSPESLWIPEYTYPAAKQLYTEYRRKSLRKSDYPLTVIVTGSGRLELERAVFHTPGIRVAIVTTASGREQLTSKGAGELSTVEIHALKQTSSGIEPAAIMDLLHAQLGVQLLLHEGGPTLFGQFVAADALDELFLTISPQIGGRITGTARPGIVEGAEFTPNSAPWFQLRSVKQKEEHLYLRYRHAGARRDPHTMPQRL
ncbi:MAG TPA: dihydrofolate reductase family protein [Terriglobales bacterium]|nr:dihydrofolate reductase family protein [Terriglobales bacterium]